MLDWMVGWLAPARARASIEQHRRKGQAWGGLASQRGNRRDQERQRERGESGEVGPQFGQLDAAQHYLSQGVDGVGEGEHDGEPLEERRW